VFFGTPKSRECVRILSRRSLWVSTLRRRFVFKFCSKFELKKKKGDVSEYWPTPVPVLILDFRNQGGFLVSKRQ
jgi:hypothetical protein